MYFRIAVNLMRMLSYVNTAYDFIYFTLAYLIFPSTFIYDLICVPLLVPAYEVCVGIECVPDCAIILVLSVISMITILVTADGLGLHCICGVSVTLTVSLSLSLKDMHFTSFK